MRSTAPQRATLHVPEPHDKVPLSEQLDINAVVARAQRPGHRRRTPRPTWTSWWSASLTGARDGDVLLVMSNGAFGGFIPTLLRGLEERMTG